MPPMSGSAPRAVDRIDPRDARAETFAETFAETAPSSTRRSRAIPPPADADADDDGPMGRRGATVRRRTTTRDPARLGDSARARFVFALTFPHTPTPHIRPRPRGHRRDKIGVLARPRRASPPPPPRRRRVASPGDASSVARFDAALVSARDRSGSVSARVARPDHPIQTIGDAVVNALAIKRLEEARRTHGERMEARMRTRARVRSGADAGDGFEFEDADRHVYDTKRHEDEPKRHEDESEHPPPSSPIGGVASRSPRRASSTRLRRPRRGACSVILGVFSPLRRLAHRLARSVVESEDFELVVVLVIFANCASLALHRPTDPAGGSWNRALDGFELALNGVFTLELALRVAHAGARAYFRDPWNRFDVLLVIVGYSGIVADAFASDDAAASGGVRALRALRALRPLRTITRFESLRSVVVCFVEAVPLLVSVVGLVVFFAFTFAVAGQSLFREAYHLRCVDPATGATESETSDEFGCAAPVGRWDDVAGMFVTWRDEKAPIDVSRGAGRASHGRACPAGMACEYRDSGRGESVAGFDNAALGMLTVFQCATLAGWAQVMYRVMDAGAETAVPYFVLLVLFGPYFVVNLFLAVLKTKFGKAQSLFRGKIVARGQMRRNTPARLFAAAAAKFAAYAERRRAHAAAAEEELAAKLEASDGTWSRALERRRKMAALSEFCRELQEHRRFNQFFLGLIYLNTVLMAVEHHGMDPRLERALVVTNFVLTFFFTVEVAVKMIGLGAWTFFADGFNRFDFVIVFLAVVEVIAISGSSRLQSLKALRGLKALRTFRVFKMFRYLASLRIIGEVIFSSLGSFISIAVLLFLFLVVFAVVGLHAFGGLRDPDAFTYGVDDPQFGGRANFDSFYHSVLLTFQVLTLEDWEFIMFRTVEVAGWGGSAFFVLWVIVGKYTFLTLFLAVTMEAFESKYDSHASSEARLVARLLKKKRERRRRRFADMKRKKRQRRRRQKAHATRPEAENAPAENGRREGGEQEDGRGESQRRRGWTTRRSGWTTQWSPSRRCRRMRVLAMKRWNPPMDPEAEDGWIRIRGRGRRGRRRLSSWRHDDSRRDDKISPAPFAPTATNPSRETKTRTRTPPTRKRSPPFSRCPRRGTIRRVSIRTTRAAARRRPGAVSLPAR